MSQEFPCTEQTEQTNRGSATAVHFLTGVKRRRDNEHVDYCCKHDASLPDVQIDTDAQDRSTEKRLKLDAIPSPPKLPTLKRPTLASQMKERKKLSTPFRSPLVDKSALHHGVDAVYASGKSAKSHGPRTPNSSTRGVFLPSSSGQDADCTESADSLLKKDYSASVAKPFRTPTATTDSYPLVPFQRTLRTSTVNAAPTIQTLQGKVQTLRQAIRIKNAGGSDAEEQLEQLVHKWTTVAREIAWALWDTAKDLDLGNNGGLNKGGLFANSDAGGGLFQSGWGYDDGRKHPDRPSGWGWDETDSTQDADNTDQKDLPLDEDHMPRIPHSLGTMLRHLGIAPETLGWDEDEGDFVDRS